MNKIFYKNGIKKNYKLYVIVNWILIFLILILIGTMIFIRNKIITVSLICSFVLLILWYLKMEFVLIKDLNFNAYVLNKQTKEFYKIGIYPKFVGALPTEEDFMKDKHFLYDAYNFKFNLSTFFKYKSGYHNNYGAISLLNALSRLHNEKYVLKQLKKKNTIEVIYKINKIYKINFIENINSYCVVCDVLKTNTNKVLEKIEMYISKEFDPNNEIKNYIENEVRDVENE